MYKKKLTKSFFDSDTTTKKSSYRSYKGDKENQPTSYPQAKQAASSEISEVTKSRLQSFTLPQSKTEAVERPRTRGENESKSSSQRKEETSSDRDAGSPERVGWRVSPPPRSNVQSNSAQKLTINEMFDIYQASQHTSQTPVKHIDPTGTLWSRYDAAEPLPYLDLELSPANTHRTPRSDARLRRSASLPTWSVDCRDRKRRKLAGQDDSAQSSGRVRSILQKVQLALQEGESPTRGTNRNGIELDESRAEIDSIEPQALSDDFGSDDIDEDLLLKLPELQTPARRSVSNPLPLMASQLGQVDVQAQPRTFDPGKAEDRRSSSRATSAEYSALALSSDGADDNSDYSDGLDEEDFLAATRLQTGEKTSADTEVQAHFETAKPIVKAQAFDADLLAGLDEDAFSDFDEDCSSQEDQSIHTIIAICEEKYEKRNKSCTRLSLTLRNQAGTIRHAKLEDDWMHMCLEEGDHVRFHGTWTTSSLFTATHAHGLVVSHPDVLVSCTSVADSHTCMRKSVLQDRVRATSQLSRPLLYGSILHAILQESLLKQDFSDLRIRDQIDMEVDMSMEKLFLMDETIEAAKDYLYAKIPLLQQWAQEFVGKDKRGKVEPMRGKDSLQSVTVGVSRALDIEERFWSPTFGLKGNVDVTAELAVEIGGEKQVVTAPLEFKTGKTTYQQSSYRAQVMLYTLMMSERYRINVSAGFLYYLESKQITRVAALHNEVRGLILMRNELARHIKDKSIPEMISNKRLCSSCYAADACFIYHKGLESGTTKTSSLGDLFDGKTGHLGERDVAFFNKWETLITKEEGEMFKYRNELWHMSSRQREEVNRCFGSLEIVAGSEMFDDSHGKMNQWTYELRRTALGSSFVQSQIADREPIIVSDEDGRYAISCGFVVRVSADLIVVQVDRPLRDSRAKSEDFDALLNQRFSGTTNDTTSANTIRYRIDRDEFKNGMGMVRNNLISLLLDPASKQASPNIARQRELIIDLVAPKFVPSIPSTSTATQSENSLNADQLKAKNKIMSAKDYALILGMPGTGKTTTIARIIRSLVAAGQSVLLTSYTHSAVDTILLKLASSRISVLRLGGHSKVHPEVAKFANTEEHSCKTFEDLDKYYNSPNVVATTCLSINHAIFQKRRFDYCIFDEASQATLPVCLGPLRFADKFILVGDHYQLPPLVKDSEARKQGLDVSLFKMLCETHPEAVVELQHQYRMNADIMSVANALIYDGRLSCGTKELESRRLVGIAPSRLQSLHAAPSSCGRSCWLQHAIDPARSVVYLNTDDIADARESRSQDHITNQAESTIVSHLVSGLIHCGLRDLDIGVISPYRSQLKLLHQDLKRHPQVVVDTADKYQGRDKECIIVSLVRSNASKIIGELLKDWRRINVAFTRAKSKMIIIGSQSTLANDKLLNAFLHMMHRRAWAYDLPATTLTSHPMLSLASTVLAAQTAKVHDADAVLPKERRVTKVVTAGEKVVLANRPVLRDLMNAM